MRFPERCTWRITVGSTTSTLGDFRRERTSVALTFVANDFRACRFAHRDHRVTPQKASRQICDIQMTLIRSRVTPGVTPLHANCPHLRSLQLKEPAAWNCRSR